ncbi:transcriptional regulator [Jiangella mangrovi]
MLSEAGMSRQGLAVRVNEAGARQGRVPRYDHTAVARWLRGQRPRAPVPDLICEVLGAQLDRPLTLADIGLDTAEDDSAVPAPLPIFVSRTTSMWRSDHLQRQELWSSPIATGMDAVRPVWEWENPPIDLDLSSQGDRHVGAKDVRTLHDARRHYEHMYRRAGGVATHARVAGFLSQQTTPMLYGTFTDGVGRELHRAIGGLTAVAGISAYDAELHGIAQRYFHQALRLAKSSGDRAFGGYVLALLVNQSLALGDPRQAIAFSQAALRTAGAAVSPALRADLHVMQAKGYALIGDAATARRAMHEAERAAGLIGSGSEPAETSYVQPGLIEAQMSEALISLGDLRPASEFAAASLEAPAHARGRVNRRATAATLALRAGDADQAAILVVDMLDHAQGMESGRLTHRFRQLRHSLAGHQSVATHDAIDRLDRTLELLA